MLGHKLLEPRHIGKWKSREWETGIHTKGAETTRDSSDLLVANIARDDS